MHESRLPSLNKGIVSAKVDFWVNLDGCCSCADYIDLKFYSAVVTFGPVAPHCFAVVCFSMTADCVAVGAAYVAWVGDSVAADYIAHCFCC